ncbi:nitroreductase [Flavobacterium sp. CS20]|jgi:nitroreductase|uniref:nitroreductase family protein n=1 Tax=Flavobacterium sp. CS20 TaxID=2775246 RepID=UPI001B3A77FE|nr:nitroreductase [Flavobacterium sp. CS20]QTY26379.1 nitroreductase [Flavobacterium sp. CS20]
MDIFDCIKHRRSVYPHQFTDEVIPDEDIQKLLELANWAPTHRKTEPWRFKVFSDDFKAKAAKYFKDIYLKTSEKPKRFKAKKIVEKFDQSSHVIAVCMQRDPKESIPEWEEIAATAMAVQNMWLATSSLNIGMYWSTPAFKNHLGKLVSLNEGENCLGFLYLGKFEDKLPLLERQSSIDDKTDWLK